MPTSITADLADTRRLLFARVNALENVLRKLTQRVELLESGRSTRPELPEVSSVAGKDTRRRARGSQPAIGGLSQREDLESTWRD